MAWTDINPYKVASLANAAMLNTLKANMEHILTPDIAVYHHPGTGGDYTVTNELGKDVDATNFNLSITTYGGPVYATFYGFVATSSAGASARLSIVRTDDISHIGRNLFNNYAWEIQRTTAQTVGGIIPFIGLPAGTHSFKLVWGCAGGTATLFVAARPRMVVVGW